MKLTNKLLSLALVLCMAMATPLSVFAEGEATGESIIDGYTTVYTTDTETGKLIVTNSHTPEKIDITGGIIWDDDSNNDKHRPETVTISLFNGDTAVADQTFTLSDTTDTDTVVNQWSHTFTGFDKYADGVEVPYAVKVTSDVPAQYTYTWDETGRMYTTAKQTEIDVVQRNVKVEFVDNDNQDGMRPTTLAVQLTGNGTAIEGKTETLPLAGAWSAAFLNLPKNSGGAAIAYSATGPDVTNYTKDVTVNSTTGDITITYTHTPEVREVVMEKVWNDNSNQDGKRPASGIQVQLYADNDGGAETSTTDPATVGAAVTLTAANAVEGNTNSWTYTWDNLPKYVGGVEIAYSVVESAVTVTP